jgi:hypothetical protein
VKALLATDTMIDVNGPDVGVQIEHDTRRGVLYVHCDGITVLRICGIEQPVFYSELSGEGE